MYKCDCGDEFENSAGLESHRLWCDKTDDKKPDISYEKIKCSSCGELIAKSQYENHKNSKNCRRKSKSGSVSSESIICDFCEENRAVWRFESGKFCCSKNPSKCPEIKNKISENTKGRDPWNKGLSVGISDRKGKSYEDIYGQKKASKVKSKISQSSEGINTWKRMSERKKEKAKEKLRNSINERYENGWRPKAGRCKKIWYESDIAGRVSLDGSWELNVAKYFDEKEIEWRRNIERFDYYNEIEDRKAKYIPDFYLPEEDTYIEVKGYETELDRCKWKQFNPELVVWKERDLKKKNII